MFWCIYGFILLHYIQYFAFLFYVGVSRFFVNINYFKNKLKKEETLSKKRRDLQIKGTHKHTEA